LRGEVSGEEEDENDDDDGGGGGEEEDEYVWNAISAVSKQTVMADFLREVLNLRYIL
jgi:hypothetical protein